MTTRSATLLILGASGDLASRLLIPGLGQVIAADPELDLQLLGAGIEDLSAEQWRTTVTTALTAHGVSGERIDRAIAASKYLQADVTTPEDMSRLLEACTTAPAIYFALPPAISLSTCHALTRLDLPEGTSLALEKPFGEDETSARALNELLSKIVPEERTHRVDHFLGRSTVLNLLGVRFANRIFEPLLNNEHVESVEIVYDEQLGLENRARYYDRAGALADMIQSHLLQVLAVFAMEAPSTLSTRDLRDAKGIVIRATQPWGGDPVAASRRARYTAGEVDGRTLPAYADEDGVDPSRGTETLAELVVEIQNWRWSGVPFTLRSGKALAERRREIIVTFKPAQHIPEGLVGTVAPDRLRILLAPDEMALEINVNGPGDPDTIDRVQLDVEFQPGNLSAYGEVLQSIVLGDPTLSVRGDTAEACWRIVDPVLEAWRADRVPLDTYPAGSVGPDSWPKTGER
ncbi:glucose-6-phosphate dehydrogenase [Planctomonas psychrotolerans]|uniref:glucose-6-phosphate dehydrogenase n=1 Tax=Planctomonas psychrotolerans TaxID=2528712 RepID=UPI00123AB5E4|nr:glucose-6-phosphate dehydrogenase [Planctomonas psychrotolerans]